MESRSAHAKRFEDGTGRSQCCENHPAHDHTPWRRHSSGCPLSLTDGVGTHSDAHFVTWQLMQILWVQNLLLKLWRTTPPPGGDYESHSELRSQTRVIQVSAVLYGLFQLERLALPSITNPGQWDDEEEGYRALFIGTSNMATLSHGRPWSSVFMSDDQDWGIEEHGKFSLHLKFFEHFLYRYLGVGFEEKKNKTTRSARQGPRTYSFSNIGGCSCTTTPRDFVREIALTVQPVAFSTAPSYSALTHLDRLSSSLTRMPSAKFNIDGAHSICKQSITKAGIFASWVCIQAGNREFAFSGIPLPK